MSLNISNQSALRRNGAKNANQTVTMKRIVTIKTRIIHGSIQRMPPVSTVRRQIISQMIATLSNNMKTKTRINTGNEGNEVLYTHEDDTNKFIVDSSSTSHLINKCDLRKEGTS